MALSDRARESIDALLKELDIFEQEKRQQMQGMFGLIAVAAAGSAAFVTLAAQSGRAEAIAGVVPLVLLAVGAGLTLGFEMQKLATYAASLEEELSRKLDPSGPRLLYWESANITGKPPASPFITISSLLVAIAGPSLVLGTLLGTTALRSSDAVRSFGNALGVSSDVLADAYLLINVVLGVVLAAAWARRRDALRQWDQYLDKVKTDPKLPKPWT